MFALSKWGKRFGGVQRGGFPEKPPLWRFTKILLAFFTQEGENVV